MIPTINDLQLVEPVLTNMLVGYMQKEARFVASRVFPHVPVDKDSGTYGIFTKKYWFTDEMVARAPGAKFARSGYGVSSSTYNTAPQFALETPIADENRANSQLPMDLETAAVKWLGQKWLLHKEIAFSADFMTTSVWGTSNTTATDWDDFAAGDPVSNITTAKRTISDNTGMDANTLLLGYVVHEALLNHPDVIDRIAYVQQATLANIEAAIGAILGLPNYYVAKASYSNTNESADFSATAVIDDDALVCYSNPAPSLFEPSAGYTFEWAPGGGNGRIYNVRDDLAHADVIQIKGQIDQKAVATDCGYFFSDIV